MLVLRSGEHTFSADLVPELELLEKSTHTFESLTPDAPGGVFDLILFTSGAAVERFLARPDLAALLSERAGVYAVGPATGEFLRRRGVARVREGGGSARSLLENLPASLVGEHVLLPRGEDAEDELPHSLAARGAAVVPLALYRKTPVRYDAELDDAIESRPPAVFFATSPSAARWFFDGSSRESARLLRRAEAIVLGEPTEAVLAFYGAERVSIARPPTFESAARLAVRLAAAPSAT